MALTRADLHFLAMSKSIGQKSTLSHSKRGAVIAKDNKVLATGVNAHLAAKQGAPAIKEDERYIAVIHAELVAAAQIINNGGNLVGVTLYLSDEPTWNNFKTMITFGIKRLIYYGPAKNEHIQHYSKELGTEVIVVGA